MGDRTRFLRQYFRYIRAGALRVGATSDRPGMDPLAFVNTGGRPVVVVKADGPGSVDVVGLPAGRYLVSYATARGSSPETPVLLRSGAALSASIPERGVLTVAGG